MNPDRKFKYYAAYLPDGEDLREGDYIQHKGNFYMVEYDLKGLVFKFENQYLSATDYKRFKLFLCDKEIKKADTVKEIVCGEWYNRDFEVTRIYEQNGLTMIGDDYEAINAFNVQHVIGYLSPDATWVKHGDEFNEDQIEIVAQWQTKKNKHLEEGDVVTIKPEEGKQQIVDDEGTIQEFLPTKEINGDSWGWDDQVLLCDVKKFIKIKKVKGEMIPIYHRFHP
jgi:hypothetical protein